MGEVEKIDFENHHESLEYVISNLWTRPSELNFRARGYVDTRLKMNICRSPQIINGCMTNPW